MSAKFFFFAGLLGVGGYVGYAISNHDASVFPRAKSAVQASLAEGETQIISPNGEKGLRVWSAGRTSKGIMLNARLNSIAPVVSCEAIVEEVSPEESRVSPGCGSKDSGSALADTTADLMVPIFVEHIQSVMGGRDFNGNVAAGAMMATVMNNRGGMQREALRNADEAQRMRANQ